MKARLRVQLLPRAMLQTVPVLAHWLFSDTLIVVDVLDEADPYQHVTMPMLATWHIDVPAIEALAVENLATASKDAAFSLALADGAPILDLVDTGDNHDAARLLLPRYLERIRSALKAEGVTLAAPTRDRLMAWPADSPARRELARVAQADADASP